MSLLSVLVDKEVRSAHTEAQTPPVLDSLAEDRGKRSDGCQASV
jgi:hypothetical protein